MALVVCGMFSVIFFFCFQYTIFLQIKCKKSHEYWLNIRRACACYTIECIYSLLFELCIPVWVLCIKTCRRLLFISMLNWFLFFRTRTKKKSWDMHPFETSWPTAIFNGARHQFTCFISISIKISGKYTLHGHNHV